MRALRVERATLLAADLRLVAQIRGRRRVVEMRDERERDVSRRERRWQRLTAFARERRTNECLTTLP